MAIPIPLTTVWTPPSACFKDLYIDPSTAGVLGSRSGCNPPGYNQVLTDFYYSPGLYCPASYTVAYSTIVSVGTVTETRATCCPNVDSNPELSGGTFSRQTSSNQPWYSSYGCTLRFGSLVDRGSITYTWTSPSTSYTTLHESSSFGINAYSVQLRWQASDLVSSTSTSPLTAIATSPQTTAGSSLRTASSIAQPSASTSISDAGSTASLSTGAKIGLGVAVPLVVLVLLALLATFFIRRKKKRSRAVASSADTKAAFTAKSPYEISGREFRGYEMEQGNQRGGNIAELEAYHPR